MAQSGLARSNRPAWDAERESFGIQVAEVIATDWRDHTVDLRTPSGAVLAHVPIATPWAGSDYGDLSRPQYDPTRQTHALVAFVKGLAISPVVIGFFYPEVSQMMLDGLQKVTRHVGDTFQAVSMEGDIWLAFTADGSHVGFHYDNPAPPAIHGTDYDQTASPATGKQPSFSAILANGSGVHIDGPTGNVIHLAAQHLHQEAKGQLDLLGKVVTISGLPALYPAGNTGLVSAPSTVDPAITVAHLTANAAYDYRPPIAGIGPNGEGILTGWTYLTHAVASRVEIGPDGKLRTFKAPVGFVGEAIVWTEVAQGGGLTTYKVPPPVPFVLAWSLLGNQAISWVCPILPDGTTSIVFNGNKRQNPSGTATLTLNGSPVAIPTSGSPLTVVEDDILKLTTTGATVTDENTLTIEAIPAALPDIASWYSVDPTTDPWTVTAP